MKRRQSFSVIVTLIFMIFVVVGCGGTMEPNMTQSTDTALSDRQGTEENSEIQTATEHTNSPFLMHVEGTFHHADRDGIVAIGRIEQGALHVGDEVEIVGITNQKTTATVRGIEQLREWIDEAKAGDNIGVLFDKHVEVQDGQVLATPGTL